MNNLAKIRVTSTVENALKKLRKAEISVYDCKKRGADFIFCVKDKDIKKVFAIFAKPCYNIVVERESLAKRLLSGAVLRVGILTGAVVFAAAAFLSNFFILKIEVEGSGAYLKSAVLQIIGEEGAGEWKPFSSLDVPVASGRILSLPGVTFCNISKRGSVLSVDVEADGHANYKVSRDNLVSDVSGKVASLAAICGTAAVSTGDAVSVGDVLIYAGTMVGDKFESGIAVGHAEIECKKTAEYSAPDDSEESIRRAYASLLLDKDRVISRSHFIEPSEDGVLIIMEINYLHKISINLT